MSEFACELTDLVRSLAKDDDLAPDGELTQRWQRVQELGLVGIGIAEDDGGSGGAVGDLMVVIRELARAGVATPIVEAATAAFAVGMAQQGAFDTVVIGKSVESSVAGVTVDLGIVPFAPVARQVLVVGEVGVAAVAVVDADVQPAVDIAGMPVGRVHADRSAFVLIDGAHPEAVIGRLAIARSAALLGSAWGAYELTRRYVIGRQQFGAPLIEIPAVSSRLAQMVVSIRAAQSALDLAVATFSDPQRQPLQRLGAAASSRIAAAQAATLVAATTHQLQGAVGITVEYGLHRHTRSLWAQRDADRSEREWGERLGATARTVGEDALWGQLTA